MTVTSSSLAFYHTLNRIREISTALFKASIVLTVLALFAHWMFDVEQYWTWLLAGVAANNVIVRQRAIWIKPHDGERYGKYRALVETGFASFIALCIGVAVGLYLIAAPLIEVLTTEGPIDIGEIKPLITTELLAGLSGFMWAAIVWAVITYIMSFIASFEARRE